MPTTEAALPLSQPYVPLRLPEAVGDVPRTPAQEPCLSLRSGARQASAVEALELKGRAPAHF